MEQQKIAISRVASEGHHPLLPRNLRTGFNASSSSMDGTPVVGIIVKEDPCHEQLINSYNLGLVWDEDWGA